MVAAEWVGGGDTGAIDAAERQREAQRGVWRCHEHGDRLGNAKVQVPGSIPTHMGASAQQQHLNRQEITRDSPRKEMSTGSSWGMTSSRPLSVPLSSARPAASMYGLSHQLIQTPQWQIARLAQGLANSKLGRSGLSNWTNPDAAVTMRWVAPEALGRGEVLSHRAESASSHGGALADRFRPDSEMIASSPGQLIT
jgi:hypothetical protein